MDRSWSHEYRVPVAFFILAPVTIVVVIVLVLLVIRINERPRYCRICQRSRFIAILARNATIFVPFVAPVKFRGTVSSHILLRLRPHGLYTSRERWTGSAQIPREIDRFTDYSPVDKVGEKVRRALSMYVTLCPFLSLSLLNILSSISGTRVDKRHGICILSFSQGRIRIEIIKETRALSKHLCHWIMNNLATHPCNKLIFFAKLRYV